MYMNFETGKHDPEGYVETKLPFTKALRLICKANQPFPSGVGELLIWRRISKRVQCKTRIKDGKFYGVVFEFEGDLIPMSHFFICEGKF